MTAGEGQAQGSPYKRLEEAQGRYAELVERSYEIATCLSAGAGAPLGVVAPVERVEGSRVSVLIPPSVWVRLLREHPNLVRPGSYLLAVDPKTLGVTLLLVESIALEPSGHTLGGQTVFTPSSPAEAVEVAKYNVVPIRVVARAASTVHLGRSLGQAGGRLQCETVERSFQDSSPGAPSLPIDPSAPVVAPRAEAVARLLFSQRPGEPAIALGALGAMDTVYTPAGGGPIPFQLPWSYAVRHILVTGTTGSGKTSLVKNLIAHLDRRARLEAEWASLKIVVLDASGDYKYMIFPGDPRLDRLPPGEARDYGSALQTLLPCPNERRGATVPALVAIPVMKPRGGRTLYDVSQELLRYAREIYNTAASSLGYNSCTIPTMGFQTVTTRGGNSVPVLHVEGECDGYKLRFAVAPIALKVLSDKPVQSLLQHDPSLSERAREAAPLVDKILEDASKPNKPCHNLSTFEKLEVVYHVLQEALLPQGSPLSACANSIKRKVERAAHERTRYHMAQRINVMLELGLAAEGGEPVLEPSLATLSDIADMLDMSAVLLDLEWATRTASSKGYGDEAKVMLVYSFIVNALRERERGVGPERAFMVFDEAHLFFPERSRSDWARRLVEGLRVLMRLGRSRGIAVLLSTHRQSDVDRLVVTLTNTKLYLRTDVKTAEELSLPQAYRDALPFFRDFAAVVEAPFIRGGYATLINGPAVTGHRTG